MHGIIIHRARFKVWEGEGEKPFCFFGLSFLGLMIQFLLSASWLRWKRAFLAFGAFRRTKKPKKVRVLRAVVLTA